MIPVHATGPAAAGLFVGVGAARDLVDADRLRGSNVSGAVRAAFVPLGNHFERQHGLKLAVPSLAVTVAWCCMAWEVVSAAGLV